MKIDMPQAPILWKGIESSKGKLFVFEAEFEHGHKNVSLVQGKI
jgi:hypothetical protein